MTGTALPSHIIDEAAEWLLHSGEGKLAPPQQQQLQDWRAQSPDHERAWQAALELQGLMGSLPPSLGRAVLGRTRTDRRVLMKGLAAFAITLPAASLSYRHWSNLTADARTATGEQREMALPDGSRLHLNSATRVNILFTPDQRLLQLLGGEILVTTAPDSSPQPRPFLVETEAGQIRALGTRFNVRAQKNDMVEVDVYQHAVAIRPALSPSEIHLNAGQGSRFDRHRLHPAYTLEQTAPAWSRGQIISDNQRLADFIAELNRYRPGHLHCDPAVAGLRISGVFQVKDTDRALEMVKDTLPIRVRRLTDYWVTILPQE